MDVNQVCAMKSVRFEKNVANNNNEYVFETYIIDM